MSALFNKPTTTNEANISLVSNNSKVFTTISNKINKQKTESVVKNATYVSAMYSNVIYVDLADISSQTSGSIAIWGSGVIRTYYKGLRSRIISD